VADDIEMGLWCFVGLSDAPATIRWLPSPGITSLIHLRGQHHVSGPATTKLHSHLMRVVYYSLDARVWKG
jgi:hypothetical protein